MRHPNTSWAEALIHSFFCCKKITTLFVALISLGACNQSPLNAAPVAQQTKKTAFCTCQESRGGLVLPLAKWVIGEGYSFEEAKKTARKKCMALAKSKSVQDYLEPNYDCWEGSFAATCNCKKIEPHKEPDKISLKETQGFGSAYTEQKAVSKAKLNCANSLSAVRTIYEKDKFKNSFKGWKTNCFLEVKNKQILSSH